jgi:hypothetical protein
MALDEQTRESQMNTIVEGVHKWPCVESELVLNADLVVAPENEVLIAGFGDAPAKLLSAPRNCAFS